MRLVVARCEVLYTGRLTATLPEATRLLVLKSDGSVLVHDDTGGYKPLNWMTPPTVVEEDGGVIVVRKRAGKTEDRLEVRLLETEINFRTAYVEAVAEGKTVLEYAPDTKAAAEVADLTRELIACLQNENVQTASQAS